MEADFLRFYGLDVYEVVYRDKVSMRKFINLISGLPGDSAWGRFVSDKNNYSLPLLIND